MVLEGQMAEAKATVDQIVRLSNTLKDLVNTTFGNWRDRYAARQLISQIIANQYDRMNKNLCEKPEESFLNLM